MNQKFWRIRGYDSTKEIFEVKIPLGCITENQIQHLLKCLAAKEGLTYNEIIGGYVKRNAKQANDFLCVQKDGPNPQYYCGQNPHFTAIIVDEDGNAIRHLPLEI